MMLLDGDEAALVAEEGGNVMVQGGIVARFLQGQVDGEPGCIWAPR